MRCRAPRPRIDPRLLRRLLRAKDRIDAAPEQDWSVAAMAGVSCVSVEHFARSFQAAFGMPPHRYLLTRRIEAASALLRDTDLSITDIALRTGWNSLGTFSRTFRDITGLPPSQVRARPGDAQALQGIPLCFLRAAGRPALESSVSEKRRRQGTR